MARSLLLLDGFRPKLIGWVYDGLFFLSSLGLKPVLDLIGDSGSSKGSRRMSLRPLYSGEGDPVRGFVWNYLALKALNQSRFSFLSRDGSQGSKMLVSLVTA